MTYIIKYHSGQEKQITEREVRDLIIFDFQHEHFYRFLSCGDVVARCVHCRKPQNKLSAGQYAPAL